MINKRQKLEADLKKLQTALDRVNTERGELEAKRIKLRMEIVRVAEKLEMYNELYDQSRRVML
jgi:septal ring factor EnvC (AmiA/AmiB activator)